MEYECHWRDGGNEFCKQSECGGGLPPPQHRGGPSYAVPPQHGMVMATLCPPARGRGPVTAVPPTLEGVFRKLFHPNTGGRLGCAPKPGGAG